MNTKSLLIFAAIGVAAYLLLKSGKSDAAVGKNGQRQLGAPPPPPPPAAQPVKPTPQAQGGGPSGWLGNVATGVGIVGNILSIWDNMGGGEGDDNGYDYADAVE